MTASTGDTGPIGAESLDEYVAGPSTGDSTPIACRSEDEVCVLRSHCHLSCQSVPPGDSTPDLDALDLFEIIDKWLVVCPACDAGLTATCTHPSGDYRDVIQQMVDWIVEARTLVASQAAEIAQLRAERQPGIVLPEGSFPLTSFMRLCPRCGDKRCPHAHDGLAQCVNINPEAAS